MEELWLESQEYLASSGNGRPRPDFSIERFPPALKDGDSNPFLELREEDEMKGKGWFAKTDIPAGTILMVAKPLVHVMDDDDDEADNPAPGEALEDDDEVMEEENEEKDPYLNELLLIQLLEKLLESPSMWTEKHLSKLYPRNESEMDPLPPYTATNDEVFLRSEALLKEIEEKTELPVNELKTRLPLILRYNVLSMETCPELLSYPSSQLTRFAGVGLYTWPSFFNHSSVPNVSRWSIGNILFLCSNSDIPKGTECCLSYIEHDCLCEPAWRRNCLLQLSRMDFGEPDETRDGLSDDDAEDESPEFPVVDDDVQNELMSMDPLERLSSIEELLQQAIGGAQPGEELVDADAATEGHAERWFQCDVQNLRILQAITLDSLGKTDDSLVLWQDSVQFIRDHLPPNDESLVPVAVQAALCAFHSGDKDTAKRYAAEALAIHNLIFGNLGVRWFRQRVYGDLNLTLRPTQKNESVVDVLWPETP